MDELKDALWRRQPAESMCSRVAELGTVGQARSNRVGCRGRQEYLPTVTGRHDTFASQDRGSVVTAVAERGLGRVEPHPYADRSKTGPVFATYRMLTVNAGKDTIDRPWKGGVDRIPNGLKYGPPASDHGLSEYLVMPGDGSRVNIGIPLKELGAPLNVGEQERDHGHRSDPRRLGVPPAAILLPNITTT